MPELPKMETYKSLLTQRIVGRTITKVIINREKSINLDIVQSVKYNRTSRQ